MSCCRRPNTYTLTKAFGEEVIVREGQGLPICIVRPSIVGASYADPIPVSVSCCFLSFVVAETTRAFRVLGDAFRFERLRFENFCRNVLFVNSRKV